MNDNHYLATTVGREGQLGTGTTSGSVVDIENETIIQVAAGALTSYAVTLSGQVYQWYDLVNLFNCFV